MITATTNGIPTPNTGDHTPSRIIKTGNTIAKKTGSVLLPEICLHKEKTVLLTPKKFRMEGRLHSARALSVVPLSSHLLQAEEYQCYLVNPYHQSVGFHVHEA